MRNKKSVTDEDWKENFRNSSLGTTFNLNLSRAMLEYLCSVADNVTWDRGIYRNPLSPNNFIATETCLQRRGLCVRKTKEEIKEESRKLDSSDKGIHTLDFYQMSVCRLTPAGEAVVQLLKMAGIFIEQDAATMKKRKKA